MNANKSCRTCTAIAFGTGIVRRLPIGRSSGRSTGFIADPRLSAFICGSGFLLGPETAIGQQTRQAVMALA
jgi:hypothetical protein